MTKQIFDCLIVGGGPAGLTAATYLARFHLSLKLIDAGRSRAGWIPCSRNIPGFPEGISGEDLLDRMREQARRWGAEIAQGRVTRIDRDMDGQGVDEPGAGPGFVVEWGEGSAFARSVLIATGLRNRRPDMDEDLHDEALRRGLIRYCPICDGYEVTDRKVGVIGSGRHGVAEAMFLRSYTPQITLIAPEQAHDLGADDRRKLEEYGIAAVNGPARGVAIQDDCIVIETEDGHHVFDSVYPALGSDVHVELAGRIGVALSGETGCIRVDDHQRTNVPGVYAAGDVVLGLDQVSHAVGEGGVAATTIRNDLAARRPLIR